MHRAARTRSLPLDGGGRLRGDVVDDAVDAAHLVDDAVRHRRQRLVGEMRPVRRHRVDGVHRADRARVLVGALVAHHADGPDGQEDGERLPDRLVVGKFLDLLLHAQVGLLEELHLLLRHLAEDAHAEARAGEGLAVQELVRHAEDAADGAHLVLEEVPERLAQLEREVRRQPAHVVVRLDRLRGALHRVGTLDDVGVDRALPEETAVFEPSRLVREDVDERLADRLALRLRLVEPLQRGVELLRGARDGEVEPQLRVEHLLHLLGLAPAQEPVVHEDAVEARPDRLVEEDGRDGRIDAAGEAQHDLVVADLSLQLLHRVLDPRRQLPVGVRAADVEDEVREDLVAVFGVDDLRVELDAEEAPRLVADCRVGAVRRGRAHLEARRDRRDAVAVAHPDGERVGEALEELVARLDRHLGLAVFAPLAGLHLAAQLLAHELHAVADAEDRHAEVEDRAVDAGRARLEDAVRPAREDDALRRVGLRPFRRDVERDDFGIDVLFADAPRDELRVLRAVVENDDLVHGRCRFVRRMPQAPAPEVQNGSEVGR